MSGPVVSIVTPQENLKKHHKIGTAERKFVMLYASEAQRQYMRCEKRRTLKAVIQFIY